MFKTQQGFNNSFLGSFAYDSIVTRHSDHPLARLNTLLDWSFVEEETADCYSEKGQRAYHPLLLFKLLIIQTLENLSERAVCEQTDMNIMYRYFTGLGLTDEVPHWTELGKFKQRIGEESFTRLFYRVLDEAERLGIAISNQRNADATDIAAKVDIARLAPDKRNEDDHDWITRNTPDPDAAFGAKGHTPRSKHWYGYKSHTNHDAATELVTAVATTDASVPDGKVLPALVDQELEFRGEDAIRQQGGDKGYVGNTDELRKRNILDYIIPRDNMREERKRKERNTHYLHLRHERPKVERKYAEGKNWHHLGRARYLGRWKVHLQGLLIYLVMNLKRIVNLLLSLKAA